MIEYRFKGKLRAYALGILPTKIGELENDVPMLECVPQELSEQQKEQALENLSAADKLATKFLRHDESQPLSEERKQQVRENINVFSTEEILDILAERLGTLEFEGFYAPVRDLTAAINELSERARSIDVDSETAALTAEDAEKPWLETLKVKAMKDITSDGEERKISVGDVVNLEKLASQTAEEVDRQYGRGGYLTPHDFGWDGLTTSVRVGDKFEEYYDGEKREVTVVEDGDGNYQLGGTDIDITDAKIKSMDYQLQLTTHAKEDIWNETYRHYGESGLPKVMPTGTQIMLRVKNIISTDLPIPYYEAIGEDSNENKFGLWDKGDGVKFGWFIVDNNESIEVTEQQVYEYKELEITNITIDRELYQYDQIDKTVESGDNLFDWNLDCLIWDGQNTINIFNGTRIINKFSNWVWELSNTTKTIPNVFEWGIARIEKENIGYAQNEIAGVVKTQNSYINESGAKTYGIKLSEDKQLYVDELGSDLEAYVLHDYIKQQDEEMLPLYEKLVEEGMIV